MVRIHWASLQAERQLDGSLWRVDIYHGDAHRRSQHQHTHPDDQHADADRNRRGHRRSLGVVVGDVQRRLLGHVHSHLATGASNLTGTIKLSSPARSLGIAGNVVGNAIKFGAVGFVTYTGRSPAT